MSQLGVKNAGKNVVLIPAMILAVTLWPIMAMSEGSKNVRSLELEADSDLESNIMDKAHRTALGERGIVVPDESTLISGAAIFSSTFGVHEAQRLAKDYVYVGENSHANFIDLKDGNILLNPEKNIVVGIGNDNIYIGSEAIIFIIKSGNDVVVYDFHQAKPENVYVVAHKHHLAMEPGKMLVLTNQNTNEFKDLSANCHKILYRNVKSIDLGSNTEKAFVANFSITSAMMTIEPLRRLIVSGNQQDRLIVDKLVKNIIIMK
jgi:hypothetical protein